MAALERASKEDLEAGNFVECLTEELDKLQMDLARQEALASRRGEVIAELKDRHVPNGPPSGLPFNIGLPELSQTWSSTSIFLMRRLKDLFPRLRLMQVPRCFQGPLIVLPCLAILGFLRGLVLLLHLLGLRLLTPPHPQVGAQHQAFRFFFFFFGSSWREA